jgi:Ca2+-binding EF-hand superfamily protein
MGQFFTFFNGTFFQGEKGEVFLDQLFRIFDKDGDGTIDFKV